MQWTQARAFCGFDRWFAAAGPGCEAGGVPGGSARHDYGEVCPHLVPQVGRSDEPRDSGGEMRVPEAGPAAGRDVGSVGPRPQPDPAALESRSCLAWARVKSVEQASVMPENRDYASITRRRWIGIPINTRFNSSQMHPRSYPMWQQGGRRASAPVAGTSAVLSEPGHVPRVLGRSAAARILARCAPAKFGLTLIAE